MKVSRTVEYGLAAVVYIAQNCEEGRVLSKNISKTYDTPPEYLLQIMQQLVKNGVLTSKKGPRGGFNLAKPATEITLLEIIEAIEGPVVVPMDFAQQTGNKPFARKIENIFKDAAQAAKVAYAKVTLNQLAKAK